MIKPSLPESEEQRLVALLAYEVLDSVREIQFDEIAKLAAYICGTPLALVSLVDRHRQWFKSNVGLPEGVAESPREISFCGHAILGRELFHVSDARADERFHDNPLVTGGLGVRFYAGAPIVNEEGHAVGTVCVIDREPRQLNADQAAALQALANQVVTLLEARRNEQKLKRDYEEVKTYASIVAQQKQQIFYAEKMAAMGRMAMGIAHEINNPLAVAIARVDRLIEACQRGPVESHRVMNDLEKIRIGTGRIVDIVNGIRSFARDGSQDPIVPVDMSPLVSDVTSVLRTRARAEGTSLEFTGSPVHAFGRSTQISQILVNLVNNALDAVAQAPRRWVRVAIEAGDRCVVVRVTDSGGGIPAELREKIMVPFFTTKEVGKGTGLGLSISQGLAESMGAKLTLDEQNENTSFVLSLARAG